MTPPRQGRTDEIRNSIDERVQSHRPCWGGGLVSRVPGVRAERLPLANLHRLLWSRRSLHLKQRRYAHSVQEKSPHSKSTNLLTGTCSHGIPVLSSSTLLLWLETQ